MIKISQNYFVGGQILPSDLIKLKQSGILTIVNNRPDNEEANQPKTEELLKASQKLGINYFHIPITGFPSHEQVEKLDSIIKESKHPIYAFCRSGARAKRLHECLTL